MSKHHVICTHPRAGSNINGILFEPHESGVRSIEPVDDDVAEQFRGCEDFEVVAVEEAPPPKAKGGRKSSDAPPPSGDGESKESAQAELV